MKIYLKSLFVILIAALPSFSSASEKCSEDVHSVSILHAISSSLKNAIERHETTYTVGVSLNSYQTPKFCSSPVKNVVRVLIPVNVNYWDEEGDGQANFETQCFTELEKYASDPWEASYLSCEDLQIDEDL